MKFLLSSAVIATTLSTSALAGGFSVPLQEPDLIDVTPQESSTGSIIIPLIFLGLVVAAAVADD